MKITKTQLEKWGACKEGIVFAERNDLLDRELEIDGDYCGFHAWVLGKASNKYTYDERGNMTSETYPDGRKWVYAYDERGNMTSVTDPDGSKRTYNYDERGNKTSETYPDGRKWVYAYDERGNMTSETASYGHTWTFTREKGSFVVKESGRVVLKVTIKEPSGENTTKEG